MTTTHPAGPLPAAPAGALPRPPGRADDPELVFFAPRGAAERLRSLAAAVVHAPTIWRLAAAGARFHGGSRLGAARRLHALRRRGYLYEEALQEGMLDPALRGRALDGHASRHVALMAQRSVNPGNLEDLTTEKAIFYRYCAALGLPTPRALAIVHRTTAGWGAGNRVLATAGDLADVLAENPVDVVVKPSDGGKGVHVRVLRRRGRLLVDHTGARDAADLWHELRANPDHDCFVVQERLRNAAELAALVPSEALHTVRLVTFVAADGQVEVTQAVMRLGIGGGDTDNFGDGSGGNGYCHIDPGTGSLGPLLTSGPEGVGFVESPGVPGSGTRLEGRAVPGWRDALALAVRAAPHFLPNRSIGWDIAITDRGPVIVEANREWTPFPQPDLLPALRRIAER